MLTKERVIPRVIHQIPPWESIKFTINLDLFEYTYGKSDTPTNLYLALFNELTYKYEGYEHIYTDGSHQEGKNGCAMIHKDKELLFRAPDSFSILSCEAFAIDQALDYIQQQNLKNILILTDSKSTLEALKNPITTNSQIIKIQQKLQSNSTKSNVILVWIPSHLGIEGNERADQAAKIAISRGTNYLDSLVPLEDYKRTVKKYTWAKWNARWSQKKSELASVRRNVWQLAPEITSKQHQCLITRLRIGHTDFSHNHLLSNTPAKMCEFCHTTLTVEHTLFKCKHYEQKRNILGLPNNAQECLYNTDHITTIIKIL